MLPQQVGFVCAVLALVCCASGLFGSLGRCRCGPPRESGGLGLGSRGAAPRCPSCLPRQVGPKGASSPLPARQVARTQEGRCRCSELGRSFR